MDAQFVGAEHKFPNLYLASSARALARFRGSQDATSGARTTVDLR